jgi:hypothetical protein
LVPNLGIIEPLRKRVPSIFTGFGRRSPLHRQNLSPIDFTLYVV